MTERTEMDRFIAWCKGIGLDGSREYRGLDAAERFRAYEKHIAAEAIKTLMERQHGSTTSSG